MPRGGKIPTFQVAFESEDDFLMAYSDHLMRGVLILPLDPPPAPRSSVRIKLVLPDEVPLFLAGRVLEPGDERVASEELVAVRLDPLTGDQLAALEACAHRTPAPRSTRRGERAVDLVLVDDSVSVRLTLGDLLRERGFRVRAAENGLEGLSAALKRVPDVILTDVEMPVMDGWKLLKMVRARPRLAGVPVVFLTRLADEMSRLRGYRMGVDDYVPKDTPPEEVVTRVLAVAGRTHRVARGAEGMRGDLEHVRLGSVLAFLEAEERSGELHLRREGEKESVLHVQSGKLEWVDNLGTRGSARERVFEMLEWEAGEFEFRPVEAGRPSDEAIGLGFLLLEHARQLDERARED